MFLSYSGKIRGAIDCDHTDVGFIPAPNGSWEIVRRLCLQGYLLAGQSLDNCLNKTVGSITGCLKNSKPERELAMIAAQDDFVSPRHSFPVRRLSECVSVILNEMTKL